jgi:predicted O-linked N-acetylglucosamine transferase (SPINDLY family)
LPELVATSPHQYVSIAKVLASDRERLVTLRAGMRQRLADSPLADTGMFVRNLESLYREWWRRWCRSQSDEVRPR